ncbi:MAG: hypothetical protein J2P20_18700 [Pseudonocardia sp.]|nr:hypothetical protein [Pseudonocardia sp.]
MSTKARGWLRSGLIVIAVAQGAVGMWQLLLPRSFYDDFPLPRHPWVAMLPPYNAHLMVDTGAQNVAMAVMVAIAAATMHRTLVRAALVGSAIFAVAHFVFHSSHLQHFPPADAVAQTVGLGAWLVLVAAMLVLAMRRLA